MSGAYLFVYGSLRPGAPARAPFDLAVAARFVGAAHARGALHWVSWYPGMIAGGGRVVGDVFDLGADAGLLAALDDYEGEDYARVRIAAVLEDDRAAQAWTYLFTRSDQLGPRIESGDFLLETLRNAS